MRAAVDAGELTPNTVAGEAEFRPAEEGGHPEVRIPLKLSTSKDDLRAVAEHLAKFVSERTGEKQEVKGMSLGEGDSVMLKFAVQPKTGESETPLCPIPNYTVHDGVFLPEGRQGVVSVERDFMCTQDPNLLKDYADFVKRGGK